MSAGAPQVFRIAPGVLSAVAGIGILFLILGALLYGTPLAMGFLLAGAVFLPVAGLMALHKVAVLEADHLRIGRARVPYAEIEEVTTGGFDVRAGTTMRRQDLLGIRCIGETEPGYLRIAKIKGGPEALAAAIRARLPRP